MYRRFKQDITDYPGCTYLITCWYTRFEVGKRLAAFWLVSVVLNAFAAIFAYALTLLDGTYGLAGWRCKFVTIPPEARDEYAYNPGIFIIEGTITSSVCLIGWFIIIDFPTQAGKFLKPEEQEFIIARINNDSGDAAEDPITMERVLHHLKDWKLYVWAFNLMASTLPGYAYSYFKTVIIMGMGFSSTESQLLSAPPYILAAATTYLGGWLTDKYQIRGPVIAIHQLLTAVGMLITAYGGAMGARYFGIFLGELLPLSATEKDVHMLTLTSRGWVPAVLHPRRSGIPSKQHYFTLEAGSRVSYVSHWRGTWGHHCECFVQV